MKKNLPKKLIKNCLEQSEETNICKYINKFWIILEDNTEYRNNIAGQEGKNSLGFGLFLDKKF